MNKRIRAFSSLFLSIALLLAISSPVLALDQTNSSSTVGCSETELAQYAHSIATSYLRVSNLLNDQTSYSLTQGIPIENDNDPYNHLFFIFAQNSSIGYIFVTWIDGEYYSSFISQNIPSVDSAYNLNLPVSVFTLNEACYLYSNHEFNELIGTSNGSVSSSQFISDEDVQIEPGNTLVLSALEETTATTRGSSITPFGAYLDVPTVSNDNSPDTGDGLCWCACVASIGAFMTETTPCTALAVYNWAKANISVFGQAYPVGIASFILPSLNTKYGLDYSHYNLGLTFFETLDVLEEGRPVYASITTTSGSAHGVVICGAYADEGANYFYRLMDPNSDSYVLVSLSNTSSRTFTYVAGGNTYTIWRGRYN